jgi:hypothetical protein
MELALSSPKSWTGKANVRNVEFIDEVNAIGDLVRSHR